jgi:putative SOS response-associated peptidase YedK
MRSAGAKITIPRFVERWFDRPATAGEITVRSFIEAHRMSTMKALEQEMFAQKKRLADAELKLQQKSTKAALENRRIATSKIEAIQKKLPLLIADKTQPSDSRIFPMNYAPIVVNENGRKLIKLARYHCRQAGKPASIDKEKDGLYNARRDNITRFWRNEFGHTHALMLVTDFYENVDRNGKNVVLHFNPQPAELMRIACVYSQWTGPEGERLLSFAAVTDEPPAEIAAAGHDRVIINIKPESVDRWLTPGARSADELQAILTDRQAPFYVYEVLAA